MSIVAGDDGSSRIESRSRDTLLEIAGTEPGRAGVPGEVRLSAVPGVPVTAPGRLAAAGA